MKLILKMFMFLLVIKLFISCTDENDLEEEFYYESQSILNSGEDETPIDNKKTVRS